MQLNQSYGSHPRQTLDIYVPEEVRAGSPVVVFFYGGSWKGGEKEKYAFVGHSFSRRGYITVIVDYRLYPEVVFPEFNHDGALALAWLERTIPETRNGVVVMGHSAGAHIAAFLAFDRGYLEKAGASQDLVRGLIGLAGPYGFNPMKYRSTRPIFEHVTNLEETKPLTYACQVKVPMLLIHGDKDTTVYTSNSRELANRVNDCGGTVDYIELAGRGHIYLVLGLSESFLSDGALLTPIDRFLKGLSEQKTGRLSEG